MKTKTFVGYHIIGATTKDDAKNEKGLLLWSMTKPSWWKRLTVRLLGIYWISKTKEMVTKEPTVKELQFETQLYKVRPPKTTKKPQV